MGRADERRRFGRLIGQTVGLGVLAVAVIVLTVAGLREDAFEEAKSDQAELARVISHDVGAATLSVETALDRIELTIDAASARNEAEFRARLDSPSVFGRLQAIASDLDRVEVASIVASNGDVIVASRNWPAKTLNVSRQEDFVSLAASDLKGTYFALPRQSRFSPDQVAFFARRIDAPDGSFLGMVHIAVKLTRFYALYSSLASLEGKTALLSRRDAGILARFPKAGGGAFDLLADETPWQTAMAAGGGVYRSSAGFAGEPMLMTVLPLGAFPLAVSVAEPMSHILAHWRVRAFQIGAGAGIALLCAGLLAFSTFSQSHRLMRSEDSLAAKSDALEALNARFLSVLENMPQGVAMFSNDRKLIMANRRYAQIYDLDPERVHPGTSLSDILALRVANGIYVGSSESYVSDRLNQVQTNVARQELDRLSNGRTIFISRRPLEDGCWLTVHEDVTARQQTEDRIEHMALHDQLTGAANRSLLLQTMELRLPQMARGEIALAILLIDLDEFKAINDTHGHPFGDALLRAVAERLRDAAREDGLVARIGGDEFAVLQVGRDAEDCRRLAEDILERIRVPFEIDGFVLCVRPSIGVARAGRDGLDVETLLRKADLALYKAKADGRDRIGWFEPELESGIREQRALKAELAEAIARGQFEVHYQPIVEAESGETVEFEALVRWRHPVRGLVRPDHFIPLAEQTDLIEALGEFVLNVACRDAARWPGSIGVSVNLSGVQFRRGDLFASIQRALASADLSPNRLTVEVTETALMENIEQGRDLLERIRELGVRVSLDDFGAGYSSLSYLRNLPLDFIKMDRSFVAAMRNDYRTMQVVALIAAIAKCLGARTVAEGVETHDQLELVRAAGCDFAQGYLFAAPKPVESLRLPGSEPRAA